MTRYGLPAYLCTHDENQKSKRRASWPSGWILAPEGLSAHDATHFGVKSALHLWPLSHDEPRYASALSFALRRTPS